MAMGLIKDMELPKDIVFFAYGMEDSLGRFYKEASKRTGDQETAQLFLKLAEIEKQHKPAFYAAIRIYLQQNYVNILQFFSFLET